MSEFIGFLGIAQSIFARAYVDTPIAPALQRVAETVSELVFGVFGPLRLVPSTRDFAIEIFYATPLIFLRETV